MKGLDDEIESGGGNDVPPQFMRRDGLKSPKRQQLHG